MNRQLVVYEFIRGKVECADFRHFLSLHKPGNLPSGKALRTMMDSLMLCVHGYDQDERELYAIAEVRRFYRVLHEVWPYSLFFCNLANDSLRILAFCCLHELTSIQLRDRRDCGVQFDPLELVRFLAQALGPMNELCERSGMSEPEIFERTRAVFGYFGLPFDAEWTG